MDARELLELAAKAAGINGEWRNGDFKYRPPFERYWVTWDPLTDDSDALRLAVKLNLLVDVSAFDITVTNGTTTDICELNRDDPYATTRRAIVKAAAEIGKELK